MGNPPGWVRHSPHAKPYADLNKKVGLTMAGVAAGVVGAAEINNQPAQPSRWGAKLQNPATWTYIWFGLALFYLIGTYLGMIHVRNV